MQHNTQQLRQNAQRLDELYDKMKADGALTQMKAGGALTADWQAELQRAFHVSAKELQSEMDSMRQDIARIDSKVSDMEESQRLEKEVAKQYHMLVGVQTPLVVSGGLQNRAAHNNVVSCIKACGCRPGHSSRAVGRLALLRGF